MSATSTPSDAVNEAQAALAELRRRRKRNAEAQRRLRERKKKAKVEGPQDAGHQEGILHQAAPAIGVAGPSTIQPPIPVLPIPSSSAAATPSEPEAWEVWSSIIFDEARAQAPVSQQASKSSSAFCAPSPSTAAAASNSVAPTSRPAPGPSPPPKGSSRTAQGVSCDDLLAMTVGIPADERKALLESHREMALFFSATPLRGLIENTRRLRMPLRIVADMDAESNVSESWLQWKDPKLRASAREATDEDPAHGKPPAGISRSDGWLERTGDSLLARLRAVDKDDFMSWDDVPANMHPCHEQLVIAHHPYVDALFPLPEMRGRYLLGICTGEINEDDMCALLLEQRAATARSVNTHVGISPEQFPPQDKQDPTAALRTFTYTLGPSPLRGPDGVVQPGWYLWGQDAMDPDNWEFSEAFVKKFPTLLDHSILRRTNWWRAKRGLSPVSGEGIRP